MAAAGSALLLLAPLLFLLAVVVAATSEGPVLFAQERVGRKGERFKIYKFRSMRVERGGSPITSAGDNRITPAGRFMRAYKLDELPQLFNVLIGEMSIVGPRPEVPLFVEDPAFDFTEVLSVRPGLTDPASLAFRHEEDLLASAFDPDDLYRSEILPAKLVLSSDYVRRADFRSDLQLVAETLRSVSRPKAAALGDEQFEERR